MKNWRARFPQIEDIDARAIFLRDKFYPATIKNDNGSVAMRKNVCDANGIKNFNNEKNDEIGE